MKILVVQIGRYGDLILTTPLLESLRSLEDAEIHVLASHRYADILRDQRCVSVLHVYKKNVIDIMQSFMSLRSVRFDLLIDPKDHFSQESTFFARAIPALRSIGFNAEGKKVFSDALPSSEQNDSFNPPLHVVDRNLNALNILGLRPTRRRPILESTDDSREESLRLAPPFKEGVKMFVLNISTGQDTRRWDDSSWIALGRFLAVRGQRMYVLAAPADHQRARDIAKGIGDRATAFESTRIQQAIALIERCDMLVTCDSAPVHIASAFNIPCVALFNSLLWNLHRFRPLSTRHRVVQPESEGEIQSIKVEQVIAAAKSLLEDISASNEAINPTDVR